MKILDEFKTFISRGNVIDLAVGVIIGGAFGKIVSSLVNDIVMPPVGLLLARVPFKDLYLNLSGGSYESIDAAKEAGAVVISYGAFINTIIEFLIVAAVIFLFVRQINRLREARKKQEEALPLSTRECPFCLSQIPRKAVKCAHCTAEVKAKPA